MILYLIIFQWSIIFVELIIVKLQALIFDNLLG